MKTALTAFALFFFAVNLDAKIIYLEPVRNAEYVSIYNSIIIGFDETVISSDLNTLISVKGNLSGNHSGEVFMTADKKKIIFKPHQPFAFNEKIEVKFNKVNTSSTLNNRLTYTFQTQTDRPVADYNTLMPELRNNSESKNYNNPDNSLAFPEITVAYYNNPSPGNLYFTNLQAGVFTSHLIIANNNGTTNYTKDFSANVLDYKRQPNGLQTYFSASANKYLAENSQYNVVDSFYCGNGYSTDLHDLKVLNNGHALLLSYDPQTVDMSVIVQGGNPNAIVTGLIIQEIDENKNVVFQWRSWDHFLITDASYTDLTAAQIDYVHGNAIEPDNDGNLLLSSRHLSEITKINRATGAIIWRMGGVHNQFTFVNDTIPFHYQHDIRRIANGNVTMFDNGNFRATQVSRALEYKLDEVNKIATLVWKYQNNPVYYGPAMGSVQRLRNGNTLICWGQVNPNFTEVTPAGVIALQMAFPYSIYSYRIFRDEVNLTLNAKLAIEGFYNTQTNKLNRKDTVRAYLRSAVSPYGVVDSSVAVVDSVNFNGNFRFYNVSAGTYYISIKHRNGLETWSKAGGESFTSGGVYTYDFTNSDTKAYGNNLLLKGSKYCIFSGDVNHDGFIELSDVNMVYNDAENFVTGYANSDLNGDNITDIVDLVITYNNSTNFISVIKP